MVSNKISTKSLMSGEKIALSAVEILSVPHFSILGEQYPDISTAVSGYKDDMSDLLGEIYQIYLSACMSSGSDKPISIELLWKTEPVKNQPYSAGIRLFVITRAIDSDPSAAEVITDNVLTICQSTLELQKYEYRPISGDEICEILTQIKGNSIKAIVKEEKAENLQNPILPSCYSYDIVPITKNDLARLVNILADFPDCAVSMQLMPTVFGDGELQEIDRIAQSLDMLSKGVNDSDIGTVSFTLAETHAAHYKYYSQHKLSPLFMYNILVYGDEKSASNISVRLFSQISYGEEAHADMKMIDLDSGSVNAAGNFYPLPWAVSEQIMGRSEHLNSVATFSQVVYRLPYIITSMEASEFFRLPIGSERVSAGLNINESGKGTKTYAKNIINGGDITVGRLKSSSKDDTIGFSLSDLAKHMLVVGTPGSGKTTFSVSLLDRLWKEHGIPFLVIEPAKNEYRSLVQSIPDLQVFTPGKNFISPFVYNPFVPPKNVKLETYKSTLKTAFAAGVSMTTPLDKIFEESINNCYSDFKWLDTYTTDDKGEIFNISDFIKCFKETFEKIGYTGDAKNIGRAGVVRLGSLINLFDNYFSIPIEDLLSKPTIIELAAIENSDQKALIIALLLLSVLAYVNANYVGEGGLKNVILLEEAHVLLDADSNGAGSDANPSAIAQGLVKRMLAEIRSYGVGLVIADQSPRKVSTDVVALTDMKVVFRLVENDDKQIIANSTNMDETQVKRLSRLRPGEAFLFFNKLDEPEEVVTPDYRLDNNISISLSDEGIASLSKYWETDRQRLRPYPQCKLVPPCSQGCDYSRRILAKEISRRIFNRSFDVEKSDFETLKGVFAELKTRVTQELNGEPYTPELYSCVKTHLLRKIKYETKIPISDTLIDNTLSK